MDQILAESHWFFQDGPGATRPFDEAPGGRAGPWRGSDDEPAKTPIVRKGEVKGVVGKPKDKPEKEPEDDDADNGKKKKQVPPQFKGKGKGKGKPKAPPKKEPDEDEDDEDKKESIGSHLKRAGARMKSTGSHQTSKAKSKLHGHLQKFAKKHGIEWSKHFSHDA